MTTISLNATDTLDDLMPGGTGPCKPFHAFATAPGASGWVLLGLRLLPQAWRAALARRARRRELELAFARLSETSPHLLADVGLEPWVVEPAQQPMPIPTRALPAPELVPYHAPGRPMILGGLSGSWRLTELDDHRRADRGPLAVQAREEARRPSWNASMGWLR